MNIARFLMPKCNVSVVYDNYTIRQGLEQIRKCGYTAVPVLTEDSKYAGTISEGDLLWYLIDAKKAEIQKEELEHLKLSQVILSSKNPAVCIDTPIEQLLTRAIDQNFIPVIDDRGIFIGIITRKDIIKYFLEKEEAN